MNLDQLGLKYGTDKASSHHNYLHTYERYLHHYKGMEDMVLVDAVGGYEHKDRGGESLRMWAQYFPKATIVGVDLYPKELKDLHRNVHLYQFDQTDADKWAALFALEGRPDVFIDDFSHINKPTIETFEACFPYVKPGGVYIVEDIEGSWYDLHGFGGTALYLDFKAKTIINYFRALLNELNAKFIENYKPSEIGAQIASIHFYTNTIIILKK